MKGSAEALAKAVKAAMDRFGDAELIRRRERVAETKRRIQEYSAALREQQQILRADEAALRQLEADHELVTKNHLQDDVLEFVKALPGVMGIRIEKGYPVVLVRTWYDSAEGDRYDMGDFEIYLDPNYQKRDGREVCRIDLVRFNHKLNSYREPLGHLFYHSYRGYGGGLEGQAGWFCFGGRAEEIRLLWAAGRIGEMLHLMIATMDQVNDDYVRQVSHYYRKITSPDPMFEPVQNK